MKFIRLDMIGHWKGRDHISSMNGLADEWEEDGGGTFEEGVSCYKMDDVAYALDSLKNYWVDMVGMQEEEFKNMQVTIFEGELLDSVGSDMEDMADCEKTLFEFNAYELMKTIIEKSDETRFGDLSEEEYEAQLAELIA